MAKGQDGLVSFPLLVAPGGRSGVARPSRWLANRRFIGQDSKDRVLIGTTKDAFFTLDALSRFLLASPLDLTAALNLDGGPVACQGSRSAHIAGRYTGNGNSRPTRPAGIC